MVFCDRVLPGQGVKVGRECVDFVWGGFVRHFDVLVVMWLAGFVVTRGRLAG